MTAVLPRPSAVVGRETVRALTAGEIRRAARSPLLWAGLVGSIAIVWWFDSDGAFTELLGSELKERGYEVALHGEPAWNGVAILSRQGLEDVVRALHDLELPGHRCRVEHLRPPTDLLHAGDSTAAQPL